MAWSNGGPLQDKMEEFSMASIQKRKKANAEYSYRVRIRIEGSPLITETYRTRKEAEAFARRMESEVRAGRYFGHQDSKERTFSDLVNRYIEIELPKTPKSFDKQSKQLRWWQKHLGDYFLCHISQSMIAGLRDKLMTEKTPRGNLRSSSTANRYMAALSRAFSVAIREWGWLKESPMANVTRPKEGKGRERFLDKDEIASLLAVCRKSKSPYLYPVTLFALSTGARKGEILGLKWDDINLSRATATFRNTKNGETRSVHLSQTILNCIQDEREKRTILSPYVFPNQEGTKPACIRTAWELAVKEIGLRDVVFHSLRHTCASQLAQRHFSSLEIAAILGHKSLSMVKRYSHLSTSSTAKALDQMNEDIFKGCVNG